MSRSLRVKKGGPDHAISRSREGLSSKIHVVVDEQILPVRLAHSGPSLGQGHGACTALRAASAPVVITDRGYDWQHLFDLMSQRGGQAQIPFQRDGKVQRSVDRALYRQRNLVERLFCKLKHFRRVATRDDKRARNFLTAIALASAKLCSGGTA